MKGRKPKPTKIKELAGNPGRRPLNPSEAQPDAADPTAPKGHLPREGYDLWNRLAGPLIELGLLTQIDRQALEMMCLHYAYAYKAEKMLRKEGLTTEGSTGNTVKHPAHQIFMDNSKAFLRYATEFGMTPSSRSRIETLPGPPIESLAEALFGVKENIKDG